ncbi:uncharacterized protein LOC141588349 [Silene latifolia]|uniref:uncharacterized protein LOC141588349 n=1 Tax=Silene latifolia TaxID=37657 RepID=UPI003D784899
MNFFTTGQLLVQVNSTIITLIPKVERPTSVKHFRPISCCNVLYKAISKILCDRLALILPDLINRSQGAFVKGRSILENILICQDLVRFYNRGMASPRCLFKLDLQKAYDSIEWSFLDQMLVALKFPEHFRSLIPGVPVQPGRLTRHDCHILLEKIVQKIRGMGARKMSYEGRLILINSVLNTLHNYWSSIFLIPKGVIHRVEAICRNFLWSSDEVYHRTPLVAWDKDNQWVVAPRGYSVSSGYHWIRDHTPLFNGVSPVWDRWNIPKQAFWSIGYDCEFMDPRRITPILITNCNMVKLALLMKSRMKQLLQLPIPSSDRLWLNCIGIVIDVVNDISSSGME